MFDAILEIARIGGVGAVFGACMFWIYRCDKRSTEKTLTAMILADQETREANTKVLTELATLLTRMNNKN